MYTHKYIDSTLHTWQCLWVGTEVLPRVGDVLGSRPLAQHGRCDRFDMEPFRIRRDAVGLREVASGP